VILARALGTPLEIHSHAALRRVSGGASPTPGIDLLSDARLAKRWWKKGE